MTPEMLAEAEAYMVEYDRKIAADEFEVITWPLDDFSDMLEKDALEGRVAKPWGCWLENGESKTGEGQVSDLKPPSTEA